MKVIGRIEPKINNESNVLENAEYTGGYIVNLTRREGAILNALQDACEGREWSADRMIRGEMKPPNDKDMFEAFWLIWKFTEVRFATNDLKATVENLEKTLMNLDGIPDDL